MAGSPDSEYDVKLGGMETDPFAGGEGRVTQESRAGGPLQGKPRGVDRGPVAAHRLQPRQGDKDNPPGDYEFYDYLDESDNGSLPPPPPSDEKPAPAQQQQQQTTPAPTTTALPQWDPRIIAMAESMGLSRDTISRFGSPEALVSYMEGMAGRPALSPAEPEKKVSEDFKLPDLPDDEYGAELRDWSKTVGGRMKEMHETMTAMQRNHDETVRQLNTRIVQMQQGAFCEEIDRQLSQFPEQYHHLIGKGGFNSLEGSSEHAQNRVKIVQEALALATSPNAKNLSPADLAKRAAMSVLGDKMMDIARNQVSSQVTRRNERRVMQPSQRQGETQLTPHDRAVGALEKYYADHDIY